MINSGLLLQGSGVKHKLIIITVLSFGYVLQIGGIFSICVILLRAVPCNIFTDESLNKYYYWIIMPLGIVGNVISFVVRNNFHKSDQIFIVILKIGNLKRPLKYQHFSNVYLTRKPCLFWWLVELPYWWKRGCCTTILEIWTHVRWDWNEHWRGGETRKNPKFLFGWRGHLVTIFDQFTFFRYSTVWTISKHSSGTWT